MDEYVWPSILPPGWLAPTVHKELPSGRYCTINVCVFVVDAPEAQITWTELVVTVPILTLDGVPGAAVVFKKERFVNILDLIDG